MELPQELHVEITEADVLSGQRLKPSCCPVALAAHRALGESLPTDYKLTAHYDGLAVRNRDNWHDYRFYDVPDVVLDFMVKFDNPMKTVGPLPISFTAHLREQEHDAT